MGTILAILGTIIAIIVVMWQLEKRKVKIRDKVITELQNELVQKRKQVTIYETHQELTSETAEAIEDIKEKQEIVEHKIAEAESDQEVIHIANDIITDFNSK